MVVPWLLLVGVQSDGAGCGQGASGVRSQAACGRLVPAWGEQQGESRRWEGSPSIPPASATSALIRGGRAGGGRGTTLALLGRPIAASTGAVRNPCLLHFPRSAPPLRRISTPASRRCTRRVLVVSSNASADAVPVAAALP